MLRVDGTLTNSPIAVASGGTLAGTGAVASVTLAAGSGFEVFANQTVPLKVSVLAAASGGKVVVHNPTGLAPTALNVPFMQVPEAQRAAVNALAWTVTMDGVDPSTNLVVHVGDTGVVYARWPVSGTAMLVE